MQNRITTLILDVGGIIRKSPPTNIHENIATHLNLNIGEFLDVFLPMLDKIRVGEVTESQLWAPVIEKFNLNISPEVLSNKYVEMHVDETNQFGLANLELLNFLKEFKEDKKIKLVAFSNTNPLKVAGMKNTGLLEVFDQLIFSHDIGFLKPDGNAFIEAIRILNESPKDLFFIDDKDANVKAAKKFGIDGAVASDPQEIIRIIKNL